MKMISFTQTALPKSSNTHLQTRSISIGFVLLTFLGPLNAGYVLAAEAVPSIVSEDTMSVAILPRPENKKTQGAIDCPRRKAGVNRWDPAYMGPDGIVSIPQGVKVWINGNEDIPASRLIRKIWVPANSELIFEDRDSTFRVTDINVAGTLRIGGANCRITKNIEFIFDTEEDVTDSAVRDEIYARQGLGIVVEPGGIFEAFGDLYQPTWTRLAETVNVGSNLIRLSESVNWREGQEIVVITSARRDYPFENQSEVRTILAKLDNKTFQVDRPFDYIHYAGTEYQVEVGLLSRKIRFKTSEALRSAAPTFGGHVMAMKGAEARISGVEIQYFGQQNFLGRYPLHLHKMGNVAGTSFLTDNAIRDSNWRCAVVHRTNGAIVSRNVAFSTYGHCFYLEDGVEEHNEISFNLAADVRIMGDVSDAAMLEMRMASQSGFTLTASAEMVNPADRAAAGFYIPNGNNRIFGNAASGGFAGYSFPSLLEAIGGNDGGPAPLDVAISHFDGNSAHSSAYFWPNDACIYVGGELTLIDDSGTPKLQYKSGRTFGPTLREQTDTFTNTKTFLCEVGLMHWGRNPRVINFEAWDVGLMVQLFGAASIQSAIVAGQTGNTPNLNARPVSFYQRGFRFYDTDTNTLFSDILFRDFQPDPLAGERRSFNSCALVTLTHSDEFTPQRMSAMRNIYFNNVDDTVRLCHDNQSTLSARNFNVNDEDGSLTRLDGDGLPPGPRIVGAAWSNTWGFNNSCKRNEAWGLWVCPQVGTQNVASIATLPNDGVTMVMYSLDDIALGENFYADQHFDRAQISGPSETRWHHEFPSGTPATFQIHPMQVPENSFVIYSFPLVAGDTCWIDEPGWTEVIDRRAVFSSNTTVYASEAGTCYIRIPPANRGFFEDIGLSLPLQTFRIPAEFLTVHTGIGK